MFRRLDLGRARLRFSFEGQAIDAHAGDSLAAALLAAGVAAFRDTPGSGVPRGPWCLMGVCFDCLVEVDGVPNRQACLMPVAEGMRVRRMRGARAPTMDAP
jgi:hypothetical protein